MSERETGPHFVWWVGAFGKPTPQVWHELHYGVGNWKRSHVIGHPVKLTKAEARLPLDDLAARFPMFARRTETKETDNESGWFCPLA